jgi:hypothetical protein
MHAAPIDPVVVPGPRVHEGFYEQPGLPAVFDFIFK